MEESVRIVPGEISMTPTGGESDAITAKYEAGKTVMVVVRMPQIMGRSGLCGCLEVGKLRLVVQGKKWYPALVLDASRWFSVVRDVEEMAEVIAGGAYETENCQVAEIVEGGDVA